MIQSFSLKKALKVFESEGVVGKRIFSRSDVEFVHLDIEPGKEIEGHELPVDVLFYIIQGSGTVEIDGKSQDLLIGEGIECLKGSNRKWINNSKELLKVLVIKILS